MKLCHYSPMKCIICGFYACYDDFPVCRRCLSDFQKLFSARCPKCGKTASMCECTGKSKALFFFNSTTAKKLLYTVKSNADRKMIRFLAELMIKVNGIDPKSFDAVTFVPRSAKNRRRYGYDQSKELAKAVSNLFDLPLIAPLKRLKGQPQKLLSSAKRFENIKNLYQINKLPDPLPKRVLLIDDICTTGATLSACASILRREMGCSVMTTVLAKTYLMTN